MLVTLPLLGGERDVGLYGKRPRRDINGGSETEVTVTSKRHAQATRTSNADHDEREKGGFLLKIPRCDIDGVVEVK